MDFKMNRDAIASALQPTVDPLRYRKKIVPTDTNTSHVQIVDKIPSGSRVLDVGCACGDLGVFLKEHKQCSIWGIEYDPKSLKVALDTGAYEQVVQIDLNAIEDFHSYDNVGFDCVVLGDVLEHLYSPSDVLRRLMPLLNKGGHFIISLPNIAHGSVVVQLMSNKFDYMEYGVLDRTHIRFFTYESMSKMFAELGLEVKSATRTIWDLPGLHPYQPASLVSTAALECIAANPHAYVLQYISKITPSSQSEADLIKCNIEHLGSFTAEESARITYFRSKVVSKADEVKACDFQPMHHDNNLFFLNTKYMLKKITPPVIWNFLKSSRDASRVVHWKCKERSRNSLAYYKPWAKSFTPPVLWDFLKYGRNQLRQVYLKFHSVADACPRSVALEAFCSQIHQISAKASSTYVALLSRSVKLHKDCPRAIAFYLPQFHPFTENDEWWGRGFTEWTNVTKSMPLFVGHYQPQLPIDLGFYDLRVSAVMHRQVELAKQYGVYGFCFHYYWFSGKRLMEGPLFNYLADKTLDLPFCLCWANEPWSRRWDGSENELLIGQELLPEDDQRFFDDILPFITDERYIRIEGKPVIIIYRPHYWQKQRVKTLAKNLRAKSQQAGLKGLYLITALSHDFRGNPQDWGFDACVEFPPHMCGGVAQAKDLFFTVSDFCGSVHDMRELVDAEEYMLPSTWTTFKTVFPAWDNTPRKGLNSYIFHHSEPATYKKWLKNIIRYTHRHNSKHEQYIFINAWNEWAEGAHLEPDRKYGYAYLQATAEALEEFIPESNVKTDCTEIVFT